MIVLKDRPDRVITTLYALISRDPTTGLEGICAAALGGVSFQAVSSSKETVEKMRPLMEEAAKSERINIALVEFKRQ